MRGTDTTHTIQRLNDELRCHGRGGRIAITRGIAALDEAVVREILNAVAAFNDFHEGNDPYREHDCASLMVDGTRVIWKIDYYDTTLSKGSENPADPNATARVLTVMLAEEY